MDCHCWPFCPCPCSDLGSFQPASVRHRGSGFQIQCVVPAIMQKLFSSSRIGPSDQLPSGWHPCWESAQAYKGGLWHDNIHPLKASSVRPHVPQLVHLLSKQPTASALGTAKKSNITCLWFLFSQLSLARRCPGPGRQNPEVWLRQSVSLKAATQPGCRPKGSSGSGACFLFGCRPARFLVALPCSALLCTA